MGALTPGTSQQLGLSRSALYRRARSGQIDRIARAMIERGEVREDVARALMNE